MEQIRKPTKKELALIMHLVHKTTIPFPKNWESGLRVRPLQDGEMGSLSLLPPGMVAENRNFGKTVSEYQFQDADGVQVMASLNLDTNGQLFELDIWKTDFSPLIRFPEEL